MNKALLKGINQYWKPLTSSRVFRWPFYIDSLCLRSACHQLAIQFFLSFSLLSLFNVFLIFNTCLVLLWLRISPVGSNKVLSYLILRHHDTATKCGWRDRADQMKTNQHFFCLRDIVRVIPPFGEMIQNSSMAHLMVPAGDWWLLSHQQTWK